jgi:hypothetical protein
MYFREGMTRQRKMRSFKESMFKLWSWKWIRLIIKVKPCLSNPRMGRNEAQSKRGEEVAEKSLTPPLLSNKRVKLLFSSPIF